MTDHRTSDDRVPYYHAAMEPMRKQISATHAVVAASGIAASGVAITTSTAVSGNPGLFDQLIASMRSPAVWASSVISQAISVAYNVLTDPFTLLHWTANEWAMFHDWLRHIAVTLIHLTPTGFH